MREINKKLLIAIPLILCVTISMFATLWFTARGQIDIPCTIRVVPREATVPVCTTFVVDVNIEEFYEFPVWDYEFVLVYDPTLMTPVNAFDGDFLTEPVVFSYDISVEGQVHCGGVTIGPGPGAMGSGTLASIEFHCKGAGSAILSLETIYISDEQGQMYVPDTVISGFVVQKAYWEPIKLIGIVEWPGIVAYVDIPFDLYLLTRFIGSVEGFAEITDELTTKGFKFDSFETGIASNVSGSIEESEFSGTTLSWWSTNTLEDGTRACIVSAIMDDGSDIAMGFVTNLLPPEQVPGVDPHIIVNAMPYLFVRFYWWSWYPIGRIITWSYWWYDSHSHPNWFWGPYWWWRTYTKTYFYPYIYVPYWRPWWGWWWNWLYWRHWYWWSTYFPYDP